MRETSRRRFLADIAALGAASGAGLLLQACSSTPDGPVFPGAPEPLAIAPVEAAPGPGNYAALYGPVFGEKFTVSAIDLSKINPDFLRREVDYRTSEKPGSIVVDPTAHYLFYVLADGRAMRYGVGVGKQGFEWNGIATINSKQEWPDWYPPKEMIERRPDIKAQLVELQSGQGVPGGLRNPLGARGMYLWQDGKDTLYRIHGTLEPNTIGQSVSSGCIRMINQDVIDLYRRVEVGTEVSVLPSHLPAGLA